MTRPLSITAETVEAADAAVTCNVSTYTCAGATAAVSNPSMSCATRLAAAIPPVSAPESATTVPATFVCRRRNRAAVPFVPTVKAAQPQSLTPVTTATSPIAAVCAMIVSAAAAGEATTTAERTKRGDRSIASAPSLIGRGIAARVAGYR
jgi:hypothetical protein